jgi:hypothetical protein
MFADLSGNLSIRSAASKDCLAVPDSDRFAEGKPELGPNTFFMSVAPVHSDALGGRLAQPVKARTLTTPH